MATPGDLPSGLELRRTTPLLDNNNVPQGLLHGHRSASGTWGRLVVHTGGLAFRFDDQAPPPLTINEGEHVVIPPERLHHIELSQPVTFTVEYYRLAANHDVHSGVSMAPHSAHPIQRLETGDTSRLVTAYSLSLPFTARERNGVVNVDVTTNTHPATVGSAEWAYGFPICEASIDWSARGYNALLGWIQLVGLRAPGSSAPRGWVTDPLDIYDGLDTPFGFYGLKPALFDAPGRSDRAQPMDWYAESFLCVALSSPMAREAHPVAGFSWGFVLNGEQITTIEPKALRASSWTKHLDLLRSKYPGWTFAESSF